jgi:hypothetical protein
MIQGLYRGLGNGKKFLLCLARNLLKNSPHSRALKPRKMYKKSSYGALEAVINHDKIPALFSEANESGVHQWH